MDRLAEIDARADGDIGPGVDEHQLNGAVAAQTEADGAGSGLTGTINMGVWAPDSGDGNEQAICACVQAAYEALTGAGRGV